MVGFLHEQAGLNDVLRTNHSHLLCESIDRYWLQVWGTWSCLLTQTDVKCTCSNRCQMHCKKLQHAGHLIAALKFAAPCHGCSKKVAAISRLESSQLACQVKARRI